MKSDGDAEAEILEVERRLASRVEQLGTDWKELRQNAARRYSLPLLIGAAAVGAFALAMAARRNHPPVKVTRDDSSLFAKVVALASLVGTLRRLPIEPALRWWRTRRTTVDIN
jgi:hypothetical protein